MSLIAFQTALGRSVRARASSPAAWDDLDLSQQERSELARLIASRGFRATRNIQRSWCEARAAAGARLTLSILPLAARRELIREWVDAGGGTRTFSTAEAAAFLDFLTRRLPQPSHAFSLCRLEQAVLRAEAAAGQFVAPERTRLSDPQGTIRTCPDAALVVCFASLEHLLLAIDGGGPAPPLSEPHELLIAPGVPDFARPAEPPETALWQALTEPQNLAALLVQGHALATIETLWIAGAIIPA